jgi:predicted DNA-binding protein
MSHTLTIRLPSELAEWLEDESTRTGIPQGQIIRAQLEKARTAHAQRFMHLAGSVRERPRDLSTRKGFSKR